VSQGLVYRLDDIPRVHDFAKAVAEYYGDWSAMEADIEMYWFADLLGVRKWECQDGNAGTADKMGKFPMFIPKTGMDRVQKCPNLFLKGKYYHREYQETVKLDGASMTVYYIGDDTPEFRSCNPLPNSYTTNLTPPNGRFGVCSHGFELSETAACKYWAMARKYDLPQKLAELGKNLAIQGELVGDTIQGNRQGFPDGQHDFHIFDIYDIDRKEYLEPRAAYAWAKDLGVPHVPVRGYVKIRRIAKSNEDLIERAIKSNAEGLVYKCVEDGRRFKVINPHWLLKHGE